MKAIFIIVAIMLLVVFILSLNTHIAGSVTTNPPASSTINYVDSSSGPSTTISLPTTQSNILYDSQNYETGGSTHTFNYILRGRRGSISTTLYSGIYNQQKSRSAPAACIRYNYDSSICTQEEIRQYYLKYLDEPTQKNSLNELVRQIKSQTANQDDQARIAISLVQNIPYDYSQLYSLYSKMSYPYEVLYQNKGVCSEKSLLLAYLLRELGYGVALFEFESENHMAVGIQSPSQYSYRNSGYAFIEATTPCIVTDSEGNYVGAGKLTSAPRIMQISQGNSFTTISEEYRDAQLYNQLISMGRVLDISHYNQWAGLVQKYGMQVGTSSNQGSTSGLSSQSYSATCDINLGRYCSAGLNCCQKNNLCYLPCSQGVWDPRDCVCIVG